MTADIIRYVEMDSEFYIMLALCERSHMMETALFQLLLLLFDSLMRPLMQDKWELTTQHLLCGPAGSPVLWFTEPIEFDALSLH